MCHCSKPIQDFNNTYQYEKMYNSSPSNTNTSSLSYVCRNEMESYSVISTMHRLWCDFGGINYLSLLLPRRYRKVQKDNSDSSSYGLLA